MGDQEQSIYQSGQTVLIEGWYEPIAVKAPNATRLSEGQRFPNYDGRAVGWHRLQSVPTQTVRANLIENETNYGGMYS